MGEACQDTLRVSFDHAIKLEFHGARVSSDAGLFPFRDLDEAVQLTESGAAQLFDFRTGSNIRHAMRALFRQSIYSRLAGYEDVNGAERLRVDPVMCHVLGGRAVDRDAASTSQVARFETDVRWTRLSCHSFDANQVRLQLHVLAYNLSNFLRRLALPPSVKHWTLTTLRDKLVKIGCKVVYHARYVTFQLAEVAVPHRLYRAILDRIQRFANTSPRAAPI
jgi:hypothetical protein